MQQLIGILSKIYNPTTTKKGTLIQEIKFKKPDNSYLYPQVHRKLELLEGLSLGDKILMQFNIFGKELITDTKTVHFTTIVIQKIIKL